MTKSAYYFELSLSKCPSKFWFTCKFFPLFHCDSNDSTEVLSLTKTEIVLLSVNSKPEQERCMSPLYDCTSKEIFLLYCMGLQPHDDLLKMIASAFLDIKTNFFTLLCHSYRNRQTFSTIS